MAGDINRVTLVGRLTRDPELRHLPSGTPVLEMGVAVNGRMQDDAGNWVDKPNFFDVKVYGNQAEMLSQHLAKGRRIGIDGRLDWRSWEAQDGTKRSRVDVVARDRAVPRQSPGRRGAGLRARGRDRRWRRRLPDLSGRRRHSVLSCAREDP